MHRRASGFRAVTTVVVASLVAACGGTQSTQSSGGGQSSGAGAGGSQSSVTTGADAGASAASTQDASSGASASASDGGFTPPSGPQTQQAARFFNEGSTAYARGDFPTAARAFRQAYDLYSSPEMAFNLARVYERMGEVGEAITFFERVLAQNPDAAQRADIERRIATLRAYEQRRRDGIAQPPASTDALTQEGLTWFQRGVSLFRRRQYNPALLAFEQAYQYTHTPELFFNLAMTHERLNHIDRAIEFFREYLTTRRGTPEEAEIEAHIRQLEQRR